MKDTEKGADLTTANKSLSLIIEDKKFEWSKQYISGRQVRDLVNASEEVELFLAIKKPWENELIGDDDEVDLARPGIENFFFRNILLLTINDKKYKWYEQYITGKQLKDLAKIPLEDVLYLSIKKPWEDELIENEANVDLARPGIEHFFSKEIDREVIIIVNGKPKTWNKRKISFEEVVSLAEGNANSEQKAYTVTYLKGPKQNPEGEMAKGDIVFVTDKMIFNATPTDKS
ncbi:multiubiquitin domain-containing protein [Pedobacter sp. KLB.chiD]|uniref:multiubiquitin domain-containing protein n=1 Tax=Pedobacter sp. KLB.chiD TaxID=3387402 RepID=UPI003999C063